MIHSHYMLRSNVMFDKIFQEADHIKHLFSEYQLLKKNNADSEKRRIEITIRLLNLLEDRQWAQNDDQINILDYLPHPF